MALDALVAKTSRGATSREAQCGSASHSGAIVLERMKIRENPRGERCPTVRAEASRAGVAALARLQKESDEMTNRSPPHLRNMVQVVFYSVPPHVRAMKAVVIVLLGYIVYKYIVQHQGQPPGESYSAR